LLLSLFATIGTPALAQVTVIPVTGSVTDAAGAPVAGFRVVFRDAETSEISLSDPTDEEGSYRLSLPAGGSWAPVSVISPGGKRIGLPNQTSAPVKPGARWEIALDIVIATVVEPRPFGGADRLFLSFVEDAVFVERRHAEADIVALDFDGGSTFVSQLVAAFAFESLPRLEFGARLGYAGTDFDEPLSDQTGLTDLEAWGKFSIGKSLQSSTRWTAGFLLTFPTGEVETGVAGDAFRSKLFGAVRFDVGSVTVSANAGLRVNEDLDVGPVTLDGTVAGSFGAAAIYPVNDKLVLVGELTYEGKRVDEGEDDARLLGGVNWKPLREGFFRLALAAGLADGAPDTQLIVGYAFDF
jgi:hypothetical protein